MLLVILAASTFAIVPETKQAVILRFEQPVGNAINRWRPGEKFGSTGAGLIARVPFIDRIVWVDKRVLDVDLDDNPGPLHRPAPAGGGRLCAFPHGRSASKAVVATGRSPTPSSA